MIELKTRAPLPCRLLKDAPAGLRLLPLEEWTAHEARIWDEFDQLIEDGTLFGGGPLPHKTCLGDYKGTRVLLWRAIGDSIGPGDFEAAYGACRGRFDATLVVSTWAIAYDHDGCMDWSEPPLVNEMILEGDGAHDVFRDPIPDQFIPHVLGCMFPYDWAEYFEVGAGKDPLGDFVFGRVPGLEQIADLRVRDHLRKLLADRGFVRLGSLEITGSVTEWSVTLLCRQSGPDRWEFRVVTDDGEEFDFGPDTLAALFSELVDTYDFGQGDDLLELFRDSGIDVLVSFEPS